MMYRIELVPHYKTTCVSTKRESTVANPSTQTELPMARTHCISNGVFECHFDILEQ